MIEIETGTLRTGLPPRVERLGNAFAKVFLEFGALTEPNGFDGSPEALHADMQAAGALRFETAAA